MKFSEYLSENIEEKKSAYKRPLTIEEASNIILNNCKDSITQPFWRGMNDCGVAFEMDGSKKKRQSITKKAFGDYYNVAFDYQLKQQNLPLRSSCVIATGNNKEDHTKHFGNDVYAIFPYDDVTVCQSRTDIWGIMANIGTFHDDLHDLNHLLHDNNITYESFDKMVDDIYKKKMSEFSTYNTKEELKDALLKVYDIRRLFKTSKPKDVNQDAVEVWFTGKCIGIRKAEYEEVKEFLEANK